MEFTKDNLLIFNNDDEFTDFALCKDLTFKTSEKSGILYHDYDYTPGYLDAIDAGKYFLIMDKNSLVLKRGVVCKGVINKAVQNLCKYDN